MSNHCMKCEHVMTFWSNDDGYSPAYPKCTHPDIKVVSFDPVYGKQTFYPDCSDCRKRGRVCSGGKLFEPKLNFFARLKRKLFS